MRSLDGRSPGAVSESPVVLILYGDEHVNPTLADELTLDGYKLRRAGNPTALKAMCDPGDVELVIFDGQATRRRATLDVLRGLRAGVLGPQAKPGLRALWMSQHGELPDVLRAFEAGADDVLRAPFAYPELLARVRALLRRHNLATTAAVIDCSALRIDTATREVTFADRPVALRRMEYALLVHLARDHRRVYTRHELLRDVWGFRSATTTTRTLDSHASRLRRKLAHAGAEGWVSATWGVGYKLAPHAAPLPQGLVSIDLSLSSRLSRLPKVSESSQRSGF